MSYLILFYSILCILLFLIIYPKLQIYHTRLIPNSDPLDYIFEQCQFAGRWLEGQNNGENDPYVEMLSYYHTVKSEKRTCNNHPPSIDRGDCNSQNVPKPPIPKNFNFYTSWKTDNSKDIRKQILCSIIKGIQFCKSNYIAEVLDLFYIVSGIYTFNYEETRLLYHHYENFLTYIKSYGIPHQGVEALYSFQIPRFPENFQVFINGTIYYRENLLNVAIRQIQREWEYVAYIDTHQVFENPYWWEETIYQLEKHKTIMMYDSFYKLSVCNNSQEENIFWTFKKLDGLSKKTVCAPSTFGGAWGITKQAYNEVEYFLDDCFVNMCDMTWVFVTQEKFGKWEHMYNMINSEKHFMKFFRPWIKKAQNILQNKGLTVRGSLVHFLHDSTIAKMEPCIWEWFEKKNTIDFMKRDDNFLIKFIEMDQEIFDYYPNMLDLIRDHHPLET